VRAVVSCCSRHSRVSTQERDHTTTVIHLASLGKCRAGIPSIGIDVAHSSHQRPHRGPATSCSCMARYHTRGSHTHPHVQHPHTTTDACACATRLFLESMLIMCLFVQYYDPDTGVKASIGATVANSKRNPHVSFRSKVPRSSAETKTSSPDVLGPGSFSPVVLHHGGGAQLGCVHTACGACVWLTWDDCAVATCAAFPSSHLTHLSCHVPCTCILIVCRDFSSPS